MVKWGIFFFKIIYTNEIAATGHDKNNISFAHSGFACHHCNSLPERSILKKGKCIPKHLAESRRRRIYLNLGSNGQSSAARPSLRFISSVSSHFSAAERLSAPRTPVCPVRLRLSQEETSIPARRQRCRRRSAVRSRGKWPRRTRSSPWRWSSRTGAPRQSSETVADRKRRHCFFLTALNQSPWQLLQSW